MRSFGSITFSVMQEKGLQAFDLVDKTGIHFRRLSKLLDSRYITPYPREKRLIAKALGVSEEVLDVVVDEGSFIETLELARSKEHMSISRLSEESGVNRGLVQRILQGRSRKISDENIDRLADALNISKEMLREKARRVSFGDLDKYLSGMTGSRKIKALAAVLSAEEIMELAENLSASSRADLASRLQAQEVLL